jgi:hypothetical protein
MLIVASDGAKSASVDEEELDRALSAYRRSEASRASTVPDPAASRIATPRIPVARARPSRTTTDDSDETSTEPYSAPSPEEENEVFEEKTDMKSRMNAANALYDKADYEAARESALEVLATSPDNVRMKRIVVSSSCIMGDEGPAREHFSALPTRDQRQMARRCQRYGIEFEEEQ